MRKKHTLNVSIQVIPLVEDAYPVVDKAIETIQASDIKHEIGPLETVLEGDDLDHLLEVVKAAHLACFSAGANKIVTIVKIADALEGTSIEEKIGKYRRVDS